MTSRSETPGQMSEIPMEVLHEYYEELERGDYDMDKLHQKGLTKEDEEDFLTRMKTIDPNLNGRWGDALRGLREMHGEIKGNEEWLRTAQKFEKQPWYGRVWETVKKHKVLTAGLTATALLGTLYATGRIEPLYAWARGTILGMFPGGAELAQAAEVAKDAVGGASAAVEEAVGLIPETPLIPSEILPLPELPVEIPSANEALDVLDALERTRGA